jgi:hypothetical protein
LADHRDLPALYHVHDEGARPIRPTGNLTTVVLARSWVRDS